MFRWKLGSKRIGEEKSRISQRKRIGEEKSRISQRKRIGEEKSRISQPKHLCKPIGLKYLVP